MYTCIKLTCLRTLLRPPSIVLCLPLCQCSFTEHRNFKVVYRRYASLFFLVGIDDEEVRTLWGPCAPLPKKRGCV